MGSRLDEVMERVRAGLADLPEGTVRRALDHYRDYIAEALEDGRTEDEILRRLGDPEEIIAQVRAEASLHRAEQNPGPVRMTGAAGRVLGRIGTVTGKASLSLGASIPYALAICLYIIAGAAFAAAVGAAALMTYGISEMAPAYTLEKIGAAGTAIFAAAAFTGTGLGLWLAAKGITRLTLRILRRGLGRDGDRERPLAEGSLLTRRIKTAFMVCAAAGLLGVGMVIPSGLPLRCFSIWNSMKPPESAERAWTHRARNVREIRVATLNSAVVLKTAAAQTDVIRVTYEEPDWLRGETVLQEGNLSFTEVSRGRIPFMNFLVRHEGTTAVTIEVPKGFRVDAAQLESKSGPISIGLRAGRITARTANYNVAIRLDTLGERYAVRAVARIGKIFVGGRLVREGGEYRQGTSGNKVELECTNAGTIEIK